MQDVDDLLLSDYIRRYPWNWPKLYNTYSIFVKTSSSSPFHLAIAFYCRLLFRGAESYMYVFLYENFRIMELSWNRPITWYLAALGVDFCYYWVHRACHGAIFRNHQVSTLYVMKKHDLLQKFIFCGRSIKSTTVRRNLIWQWDCGNRYGKDGVLLWVFLYFFLLYKNIIIKAPRKRN